MKKVYTISPGLPFIPSLVNAIMTGQLPNPSSPPPDPSDLSGWTILVPTRRAARALMEAFVPAKAGTGMLLPDIQPLGDVDEDELAFLDPSFPPDDHDIPVAMDSLSRRFVLASLILDWAAGNAQSTLAQLLGTSRVHSFDLARLVEKLLDRFETGEADIARLAELFAGEFPEHRYNAVDFLSWIESGLSARMKQLGCIGPARRRAMLIDKYTKALVQNPPAGPVIAAGSTGSIPATARLLAAIAGLDLGAVVLPGLDLSMDEDSWQSLQQHHPQYGLHELLQKMEVERSAVHTITGPQGALPADERSWLASEIMRPAATTDQWRKEVKGQRERLERAMNKVTVITADDQHSQARIIALIMRKAIEDNRTLALVTPDRNLAGMVKAVLGRWQIEVDDSAGEPLSGAKPVVFMRLLLAAALDNFQPAALKALLAHPLFAMKDGRVWSARQTAMLEVALLRKKAVYEGLDGLHELARREAEQALSQDRMHPAVKRIDEAGWQAVIAFAGQLKSLLQPLEKLARDGFEFPLQELVKFHLDTALSICANSQEGQCLLWQAQAGEELSHLIEHIRQAAGHCPDMTLSEYAGLFDRLTAAVPVRTRHARHNSLAIYGLLEARMANADIFVLAGLNETIWPAVAETDPWLTRPQMQAAGLPAPERAIGLSAHDFVQGFCQGETFLTCSRKVAGTPVVRSRWLLRLEALLEAAGLDQLLAGQKHTCWLGYAGLLDEPDEFAPVSQPQPRPPLAMRQKKSISVSAADTLISDRYAFFARYLLRLPELDALQAGMGPAEFGLLVHKGLETFMREHGGNLARGSASELTDHLMAALEAVSTDTVIAAQWRPRLVRIAKWFVEYELARPDPHTSVYLEVSGKAHLEAGPMSCQLTARADRIDRLDDGSLRIIDYKTGNIRSTKQSAKNFSAQLLLEAAIARHGDFDSIHEGDVSCIEYLRVTGGEPAGTAQQTRNNLVRMADDAFYGLAGLLAAFGDEACAYTARPVPVSDKFEGPYEYLSRWREWAHLRPADTGLDEKGGGHDDNL